MFLKTFTALQDRVEIKSFVKGKWFDLDRHYRKCKHFLQILLKSNEIPIVQITKKDKKISCSR